jgi:predicted Zn-dependent protease
MDVRIVSNADINAFALLGANIRMFRGLLDQARNPDELAIVLGHEMGHVANRDVMRNVINAGGISFVLGSVLGDFSGGTAAVLVAQSMLSGRYSREAERRADAFAVDIVKRAGGDESAARRFFARAFLPLESGDDSIFATHPLTGERIESMPVSPTGRPRPLLDDDEWQALKGICSE